jgi:hypothetical protein
MAHDLARRRATANGLDLGADEVVCWAGDVLLREGDALLARRRWAVITNRRMALFHAPTWPMILAALPLFGGLSLLAVRLDSVPLFAAAPITAAIAGLVVDHWLAPIAVDRIVGPRDIAGLDRQGGLTQALDMGLADGTRWRLRRRGQGLIPVGLNRIERALRTITAQ